ncbi:MAG: hypothetical protein IJ313_09785 [Clostridia bacterium]|nr:hypothetical protein [Clostridia bacterium]
MGMENKSGQTPYYRLHTDAVEDLATANVRNTPVYSKEELEKYTSAGKKRWLPVPLKVLLIKAWFYGAVCFFVFWGLGLYVPSQLDLCVIAAIIMGLVTDLLINTLLRFGERRNGDGGRHMMVDRTGVTGMLLNLAYAFLLMFLIVTAYAAINAALGMISLAAGISLFLGVGPISFGLIAAGTDTLMIACKRMLLHMAADARRR